ncbi:MAG: 3-oxoadipate enol-lactonase [Deltaproteobacteria bacterium CG_4_8_14_3_um_filter_45_9]|nr:MAG: 3-oxoadipate enol-lactonase [Deltaproteobacteria bacterium CG03_land_8_20_14_0_80_45_14]PIX25288.1 MAG: 3-oxoadipate enol-lactonase [Deltaproteobacteria bacterium CG_4_8_14_3_um_filter_45_9]
MQIKANGIQINYELSGKKGAPVVVLSHSLNSSLLMWNPQMEALNPHFQVLRYDIRGHGGSDTPSGAYTLELLGEDVIGLLDALSINKVHFVGLSMGGMIGQSLALNYVHRLRSLALCDTASIIPQEAQPIWQERIEKTLDKGMASQVDETMARWFTPSFLKQNPPMLDLIRKQILATPVVGYLGCAEAIRRLNYLDRLSEIKMPTLIMVGEDDPGTPVSASKAIHERISNSKLVILPSARHLSNIEQTQAFNSVLLEFLKNL